MTKRYSGVRGTLARLVGWGDLPFRKARHYGAFRRYAVWVNALIEGSRDPTRLKPRFPMHKDTLLKRLNDKTAVIGIVGLGYVGLPLSLRYAEVGYKVVGFDIDQSKVDVLK